jgi:hypothetical protein
LGVPEGMVGRRRKEDVNNELEYMRGGVSQC